jgi:hypothetical protein
MSPYDAVINYLNKDDQLSQLVTVPEPQNLDSNYLFPNEQSQRPTEYSVIIDFLQQSLSTHK